MNWTVRQDSADSGDHLMAEDARLLDMADRGLIGPVLRFYEWSKPTISLGFHQSPDLLDLERLRSDSMPWTCRPTGGAAVLHSDELTYAFVIPFDGRSTTAGLLQEYASRALAAGLRFSGVNADVAARGEPLTMLRNRTSCFVRTSRWEVTVSGRKIVGSAQRKSTHALLQHGSILIGQDHLRIVDYLKLDSEDIRNGMRQKLEGKSTCIRDVLGEEPDINRLRENMSRAFVQSFANLQLPALSLDSLSH